MVCILPKYLLINVRTLRVLTLWMYEDERIPEDYYDFMLEPRMSTRKR